MKGKREIMTYIRPKRVLIGIWIDEAHARKLYAGADQNRIPVASVVRRALFAQTQNLTNFDDLPPDPIGSSIGRRRNFVED
jgi:hypothetical protein